MARTAIYARKSTEADDRQVLSLDAQLHWAREACAMKLRVADPLVFQEARSAKLPGREVFGRLMAAVTSGEVDTVVCWKTDRLARNAADAGAIVSALETRQLRRIVTSDGTYAADDDDSTLMLGILLGFSAKYSKDLSKNIRRGLEEKWRRGEWTGHAPLGYRNVREGANHAIVVVDPTYAPWIRELFRLAGSGSYSINDLGRIARKEWKIDLRHHRRDGSKCGLSLSAIHRILRNPFYMGLMRIKGETYMGTHEPLVSKELFEQVQATLSGRRVCGERTQSEQFALSGIVRCGACGRRLVGVVKRKRGREYRYYVCTKHIRKLCPEPPIAEPQLTSMIREALARVSVSERDFRIVAEMLDDAERGHRDDATTIRARLERQIADLDRQTSRLVDLLVRGGVSQEDYDLKRRELASRRAQQILEVGAVGVGPTWLEPVRDFFRGVQDAENVFARGSAPVQRGLLRRVGLELSVRDRKPRLHAQMPASILMNRGRHPAWWRIVDEAGTYFTFRSLILSIRTRL